MKSTIRCEGVQTLANTTFYLHQSPLQPTSDIRKPLIEITDKAKQRRGYEISFDGESVCNFRLFISYRLSFIKHIAASTPIIANNNTKPGIGVVVSTGLDEGV